MIEGLLALIAMGLIGIAGQNTHKDCDKEHVSTADKVEVLKSCKITQRGKVLRCNRYAGGQ